MDSEQKRGYLVLGLFGLGCYMYGVRAGVRSVPPVKTLEINHLHFLEIGPNALELLKDRVFVFDTSISDLLVQQIPKVIDQAKGA